MINRDFEEEQNWQRLLSELEKTVSKKPRDLNGVLFLVGVNELGKGAKTFSKEEKQDLMHIAICKLLSQRGYYELVGVDQQGWPHWKAVKQLPAFDLLDQEKLLKSLAVEYFQTELGWQV